MGAFRYEAVEAGGGSVRGVIEAEDRKSALSLLAGRGIFASDLQACAGTQAPGRETKSSAQADGEKRSKGISYRFGSGISRKEITAFTREMAALLGAAIPIPQALDGLGEEEENAALRGV